MHSYPNLTYRILGILFFIMLVQNMYVCMLCWEMLCWGKGRKASKPVKPVSRLKQAQKPSRDNTIHHPSCHGFFFFFFPPFKKRKKTNKKEEEKKSKSLLPPRLNRKHAHSNKRRQHQRPRDINRGTRILPGRINRNQRRTKPRDPIQAAGDTRSRPADWRGEHLGRVRVEHAVGDILKKGLEARADQLGVGGGGGGEAEEDHAGDHGGDGHGAFAADVFDFDGVARED